MEDIDLAGIDWQPIGTSAAPFTGIFDGNGYTIRNLNINAKDSAQGLFGSIGSGGIVKKLGLADVSIVSKGSKVGGIAGHLNGGTIEKCFVTGKIEGNYSIGGVVGLVDTYSSNSVRNCFAAVDVRGGNANDSAANGAGGVVGFMTQGVIENCYATGTVRRSSSGTGAGGVAGTVTDGIVRNCVALNQSIVATSGSVGRVIGSSGGTSANNYAWDGLYIETSNASISIAKGTGTTDGADVAIANYQSAKWWMNTANWNTSDGAAAWSFDEVWTMENGDGYPVLR
jgi:hypothetical protein